MRYVKALVGIIFFYVLPLGAKPHAFTDPRLWLAAAAAIVLLVSQPDMKTSEARAHKSTDNYSVYLIILSAIVSLVVPVIDWAYLRFHPISEASMVALPVGLSLVVGGLGLRVHAIRYLGRFFTATVRVVDGQHVITTGPYAVVRHPSYLGAYLAIIGCAIMFQSVTGVVLATASMLLVYAIRISCEERLLVSAFGSGYVEYQRATKRLIPYVW